MASPYFLYQRLRQSVKFKKKKSYPPKKLFQFNQKSVFILFQLDFFRKNSGFRRQFKYKSTSGVMRFQSQFFYIRKLSPNNCSNSGKGDQQNCQRDGQIKHGKWPIRGGLDFKNREMSHLDVFSKFCHRLVDYVANRLTGVFYKFLAQQFFQISRLKSGDVQCQIISQRLKLAVSGDKVGFAQKLNHHAEFFG